ncbi:MAG: DNA-processing protein DprA [Spirochaetales bacterium]|nr:DNA-processing protein DprA [Spirochaetales bacterium]
MYIKDESYSRESLQIAISLFRKTNCYQKSVLYKKLSTFDRSDLSSFVKRANLLGFSPYEFEKKIDIALNIEYLLDSYNIRTVCYVDEGYPELLKYCYDPPFVLYYRGILENRGVPPIAIVGTRYPDILGIRATEQLSGGLASLGFPVVSGLARGVDVIAHKAALDVGGYTIAVMAGGVESIYPLENRAVGERILQQGGALISEYPPETPVRRYMFPARNRIIAWMSRGVIVAQAPERSGALITAKFALDENRDVFVPSISSSGSVGAGLRKLASDGAVTINSSFDVLRNWGVDFVNLKDHLQKDLFF